MLFHFGTTAKKITIYQIN